MKEIETQKVSGNKLLVAFSVSLFLLTSFSDFLLKLLFLFIYFNFVKDQWPRLASPVLNKLD